MGSTLLAASIPSSLHLWLNFCNRAKAVRSRSWRDLSSLTRIKALLFQFSNSSNEQTTGIKHQESSPGLGCIGSWRGGGSIFLYDNGIHQLQDQNRQIEISRVLDAGRRHRIDGFTSMGQYAAVCGRVRHLEGEPVEVFESLHFGLQYVLNCSGIDSSRSQLD